MRAGKGFTLIELVVTVAIVAILATIALASYQHAIVKSRRGSAKAFLMEVIAREQQYLLDARQYASTLSDLNLSSPSEVSAYYSVSIAVDAGPPPLATVTATPISGKGQESDGTLQIKTDGSKSPAGKW